MIFSIKFFFFNLLIEFFVLLIDFFELLINTRSIKIENRLILIEHFSNLIEKRSIPFDTIWFPLRISNRCLNLDGLESESSMICFGNPNCLSLENERVIKRERGRERRVGWGGVGEEEGGVIVPHMLMRTFTGLEEKKNC